MLYLHVHSVFNNYHMQLAHWPLLSLTTNPSFHEFKNPEHYMYLVTFYWYLDLAHHRIFTTRYDINFVTGMHAWSNSLPVLIMELWYYGLERHLSRKHDLHKEIFPSSVNVNQLKLCHWYCILVLYTGILVLYTCTGIVIGTIFLGRFSVCLVCLPWWVKLSGVH